MDELRKIIDEFNAILDEATDGFQRRTAESAANLREMREMVSSRRTPTNPATYADKGEAL